MFVKQIIILDNNTDIVTLLQNEHLNQTTLTEFFKVNEQAAAKIAGGERLDFDCRALTYQDFPTYMV